MAYIPHQNLDPCQVCSSIGKFFLLFLSLVLHKKGVMAMSIFRYIKRIIYNMKIWQNILKIILRHVRAKIWYSNNLTMIPIWFYWCLPNKAHGYQLGQKMLISPSLTSFHVLKWEWPARWQPVNKEKQKQFVSHFNKHDNLLCFVQSHFGPCVCNLTVSILVSSL